MVCSDSPSQDSRSLSSAKEGPPISEKAGQKQLGKPRRAAGDAGKILRVLAPTCGQAPIGRGNDQGFKGFTSRGTGFAAQAGRKRLRGSASGPFSRSALSTWREDG